MTGLADFDPLGHRYGADHEPGRECNCAAVLLNVARDLERQALATHDSASKMLADLHAEFFRQVAELIEAGDQIWDGSWARQGQYETWKAVADRVGGRLTVDHPERLPASPSQLDRIEAMLVRLTHTCIVNRGYSGKFTMVCSCGWRGEWRYTGEGCGPPSDPQVLWEGHLATLLP